MELKKTVVVFIALAICTSAAFNHLTPWDKEVIYDWQALILAGTHLPTPHASHFHLCGKIHLQSNNNATHVKITDLTYKLYNGILDHHHENQAHSVPVQIEELSQVFKVVYDSSGLAVGIATETQDKEFSRNIKKAIATTLQMDDSVLKHEDRHHYGAVFKEHSIYGKFDVDYDIKHHKNGEVEVHKLHDMHSPHHLYENLVSNNEQCRCDVGPENPISHKCHKQYTIVKQDGHHVVQQIKTHSSLIYQPFKSRSDHQSIFVNQTLTLEQMVPIQEQYHVQSQHFEPHLTYHFFTESLDGVLRDVTNGRHVVNYEKLLPNLQHMLQDVHQYLHEDHIHTREPDTKRGQLINRIQRLLQMVSLTKFHELHKKLNGDALKVFHHMLPLVGSRASILFIKHLVMDKVVSDDICAEMLQHLHEHVVEPTVDLLAELEELIHLGDDFQWNVRRCAILSFAALVHKSHVYTLKNDEHQHQDKYHHQHPYEKYVVEYGNKAKSSEDYKIRMTYTFALCNMKLHSIIHYMLPGLRGEWDTDYHGRIMNLWAVGCSVIVDKDPNTVMETIWPIFVDVDEITELRVLAFYFLMESRPNQSRLINLLGYLLKEENEEVYNFAYTCLQSILLSHDPCKQEFRIGVSHLFQLLPPPTHGKSYVKLQDYKDVNYGFGGSFEHYFASGDHSLMYGFVTTSQLFNIQHEGYRVYFKIHGVQNRGDPVNMLVDLIRKKTPKAVTGNKDVHIECVIFRHGQIINTCFFDQHNLHEMNDLLDFFAKETHSMTKDLLHVSYNEYHKAVIPTDLGTPAVWEYLMPVVHHNNISITKETVNKVINLHVDNRYVIWANYRHGLSFYNPVVDVWQGINRFHAYDTVLPLHFDVSLNMQQQSLQLSWKKHSNQQMNVAGVRSHVKQMVFVKDDHNRNVLLQSSPQCKDFVIVGYGKEFRHQYTYHQDDDLTTGHQWYVGLYDSNVHTSNGSFRHLLHQFTQSHPKSQESPLCHFMTTLTNMNQHIVLLPRPGSYGFISRLEPSHQHAVSNIDLSLRLHAEPLTDDSCYYCPKTKYSTRMTYAVKNEEQSLKTWDVNSIVDLNQCHTINNLKMQITRIVPGQKDYKICVEGVKKWTEKGVDGHLNIAMSQTSDGKCVKDDTVIDVTMSGQHSEEQGGHFKYDTCQRISPYSLEHKHSLECLADHTTARHYVYNVKMANVPVEFKKTFAHWWDSVKGYHMDYYHYEDEHNENIDDHALKVDVVYPMQAQQMDVHVTTPQHVYRMTGVPTHYWKWMGLFPDSIEYPAWFQFLHHVGFVDHCTVELDHYHFNRHEKHDLVPEDWTLYVANTASNPQKAVYIKKVANNELAVKVVDNGHTVEVAPHGASHQITVDGQVVPVTEYHHTDWVYCHVFTQDSHSPVACMLQNSGIHLEYHHHQVVVVIPKVDQQLHGRCYSHQG